MIPGRHLQEGFLLKPIRQRSSDVGRLRKGWRDQYKFLWHGYADDVVEKGEILSINENDHIAFTFSGNCHVSIWLKSYQDSTIVELTQSSISREEDPNKNLHVQCSVGWTFYLTNLKSILEGGIDLRNRDVNLQDMVTA